MKPLISCVLVTRDRPGFFRQALRCFAAQDYPNKELVVVDDGDVPVGAMCDGVEGLTYVRLKKGTPTGSKLNVGVEIARGDILQKIDDDDYYGPAFLSTAAARLRRARASDALVVWCCFAVLIAGERRLYFSGHGWSTGGTLCFRRALWRRHPFRDMYASSDSWFIRDNDPTIARVCAPSQYLVVRHGANTWTRIAGADSVEAYFRQQSYPGSIPRFVGRRHAAFYQALARTGAPVLT
jgi:glycosyltransferase involved in cell wall biosynthesis